MAEFDFKELVARAHFDYVGPAFPAWWAKNKTTFVLPDLHDITAGLRRGGTYFTELQLRYDGEIYDLPNEPLIGLSLKKTIVETATIGTHRRGTVKEYINTEDWQIVIRGVAIDLKYPDNYPSEQVETLNKLFAINDAVEVVSNVFLGLFGIERLVLKDLEIDSNAGMQSSQKYRINAVSEQSFFADMLAKEK